MAQLQLDQAELNASRARANRLPDPTVGVFTASEAYSNEKIVGVSLSIPIPGRYRNHQLGLALDQVNTARALRDRQQRLIEMEVAEAYADATGNYERWRLAEESAAKTRESANLTQRAYSLGEVDLQTLLLSRRQAVEALDSALDARVSALTSYNRLLVDAHLIWELESN
jgi:outer membrane protein TolC